jgi:hypothetical protein
VRRLLDYLILFSLLLLLLDPRLDMLLFDDAAKASTSGSQTNIRQLHACQDLLLLALIKTYILHH